MDFIRAIVGILVVIGLAFLLGWTQTFKHPAPTVYCWIFAVAVMILLRFFL
jgi:hypothetical protein